MMRILRVPIADETKQEVVTKWLGGWARDKIAREIGIGAGNVTNIIANWTNEVGTPTAAALRELSVEIRRAGMSRRECARGLRITRVLSSTRDFIEQSKKDVKEVSDLAIKAIKLAHEDRTDVDSM
jgi:hypothetical protein